MADTETHPNNKLTLSIGIMAHNEQANIGSVLDGLLNQKLQSCTIGEIIVVASGCTDDTESIVQEFCERDSRVKLLTQAERQGKPSAINLWLKNAHGDVCVMVTADVMVLENTVENLVKPLLNPEVGFVGAHPMPINDPNTFPGFLVHLYWKLHHAMALNYPKGGEMIAFRNIVPEILNTASDEANIEAILLQQGFRLSYASDAIVRNKGPETVKEYLKQRRRQKVGHIHLKKALSYETATMNDFLVLRTLLRGMKLNIKTILWTIGVVTVELYARLLAMYDWYIKKETHVKWAMVTSTKKLET